MKKISREETRTIRQLTEQYEIEKELSNKLRNATKEERKNLYGKVYDEFYQRVPHHPQLKRKEQPQLQRKKIHKQVRLLSNFFAPDDTFMELGPGDCNLAFELCKHFKKVYAIDVSEEIAKNSQRPTNFELVLSDGISVDIEPQSVDIAYSYQLMEHLHPEDAFEQLQNIYNALVNGGVYICITPHRFMGPHDISKHFDTIATGFHLKEYINIELYSLFKSVGFRKVQSLFGK